jgi:formylglycine-generating enzyme required for sulfatase activity
MKAKGAMRLAVAAGLVAAATQLRAVTIDLVPVGDPGNVADFRHDPLGFGAVEYAYRIGTYEVTNGQYREFLNAKATLEDPHGLYNELMAQPPGGIERTGAGTLDDPWTYLPSGGDSTWDSRPVNFVGFWDAARFINWLHNGQADGDTETGAYANLGNEATFTRLPEAQFFIPTENEWYKAAYYDPHKPIGPGYWEFPTRGDVKPSNDPQPGADLENGSANYSGPGTMPVGGYSAKPSTSAYGTYDQGGNLWEWNETFVVDDFFGLRGGSFDNTYGLEASHRDSYPAFFENRIMGFRVAAPIPEPATAYLLVLAAAAYALVRRMRYP